VPEHSLYFVAGLAERRLRVKGNVLVPLEASCHPLRSRRDRYDPFARQLRGAGDRGRNMFRLERRELAENPLGSFAGGEIIQNHGHGLTPRGLAQKEKAGAQREA